MNKLLSVFEDCSQRLDGNKTWMSRVKEMRVLQEVVTEGVHIPEFARTLSAHPALSVVIGHLITQLSDLRSEVVKCASVTTQLFCRELNIHIRSSASRIIESSLSLCGGSNKVCRGYVLNCFRELIFIANTKKVLALVLETVQTSRNKLLREACAEFLLIILHGWGLDVLRAQIQVLESAIKQGISGASPETRSVAARCFWVFLGHFPERGQRFPRGG
jgi:hypothetical protein